MRETQVNQLSRDAIFILLTATLALVISCRTLTIELGEGQAFSSPQAAGDALLAALKSDNTDALAKILGKGSEPLLTSGDPVINREQREQFVSAYDLEHSWTAWSEGVAVLEIGENGWPFPIPVLEGKGGWRFDTAEGAGEILNRRIGKNELDTIQACLAFVDAEREYYLRNPRNRVTPEYARFILSNKGEKDGLYWATSGDEAPSPLGALYAAARSEGYSPTQGVGKPFHGYLYRALHAQGANAPGGAYHYIEGEEMTGGFALLSSPAKYGASGIMTFLVNQIGLVYQKDLGSKTEKIAAAMKTFDPDDTWTLIPAETLTPPCN